MSRNHQPHLSIPFEYWNTEYIIKNRSVQDLMEELNCTKAQIKYILRKYNLKKPDTAFNRKKLTKYRLNKEYKTLTCKEIATKYDLSIGYVQYLVEKYNIERNYTRKMRISYKVPESLALRLNIPAEQTFPL